MKWNFLLLSTAFCSKWAFSISKGEFKYALPSSITVISHIIPSVLSPFHHNLSCHICLGIPSWDDFYFSGIPSQRDVWFRRGIKLKFFWICTFCYLRSHQLTVPFTYTFNKSQKNQKVWSLFFQKFGKNCKKTGSLPFQFLLLLYLNLGPVLSNRQISGFSHTGQSYYRKFIFRASDWSKLDENLQIW